MQKNILDAEIVKGILPRPQKMTVGEKKTGFCITYQSRLVCEEGLPVEYLYPMQLLQEQMKESLGYSLTIAKGSRAQGQIFMKENQELSEEEYRIRVTKEGIIMEAGAYGGALYAVQTLRQLVGAYGAVLPELTIHDYPEKKIRGFYHDVTRGRIPTLQTLKRLADKLAFYKINQLQLYVEHSFLFEGFSEVWRDDTPLTAEEIMELDVYCQKLHIDLVPSLASFGHLYKVLRTKTYKDLCELPDSDKAEFSFTDRMEHHTLDVSNPESIQFVYRMLDEYMPLFSSKYFNLCGDETFDLGKGRSKSLADEKGSQRIYIDFVKLICEYLIEKGKTPMFWGDIISAFPEAVHELPKETICLNWGYEATEPDTVTKKFHEAGATQILCPGISGWNEWINQYETAYENIKRMCTYSVQYDALGVLNTNWGDYGHINDLEFAFIGIIYGAAFSWNKEILPYENINEDISRIEYKDSEGSFVSIIEQIPKQTKYHWYYASCYKDHCQGRIVEKGSAKILADMTREEVERANETLETLIYRLYEHLPRIDETGRDRVRFYIHAAEGLKIWNEIGLAVKEKRTDAELAARLEYWYHDYKGLWRENNKESELYRIGKVIFWYADLLRG